MPPYALRARKPRYLPYRTHNVGSRRLRWNTDVLGDTHLQHAVTQQTAMQSSGGCLEYKRQTKYVALRATREPSCRLPVKSYKCPTRLVAVQYNS